MPPAAPIHTTQQHQLPSKLEKPENSTGPEVFSIASRSLPGFQAYKEEIRKSASGGNIVNLQNSTTIETDGSHAEPPVQSSPELQHSSPKMNGNSTNSSSNGSHGTSSMSNNMNSQTTPRKNKNNNSEPKTSKKNNNFTKSVEFHLLSPSAANRLTTADTGDVVSVDRPSLTVERPTVPTFSIMLDNKPLVAPIQANSALLKQYEEKTGKQGGGSWGPTSMAMFGTSFNPTEKGMDSNSPPNSSVDDSTDGETMSPNGRAKLRAMKSALDNGQALNGSKSKKEQKSANSSLSPSNFMKKERRSKNENSSWGASSMALFGSSFAPVEHGVGMIMESAFPLIAETTDEAESTDSEDEPPTKKSRKNGTTSSSRTHRKRDMRVVKKSSNGNLKVNGMDADTLQYSVADLGTHDGEGSSLLGGTGWGEESNVIADYAEDPYFQKKSTRRQVLSIGIAALLASLVIGTLFTCVAGAGDNSGERFAFNIDKLRDYFSTGFAGRSSATSSVSFLGARQKVIDEEGGEGNSTAENAGGTTTQQGALPSTAIVASTSDEEDASEANSTVMEESTEACCDNPKNRNCWIGTGVFLFCGAVAGSLIGFLSCPKLCGCGEPCANRES